MSRPLVLLGVLVASLLVAGVLSLFASEYPDGLERVAIDLGFEHSAQDSPIEVMPDYSLGGSAVGGATAGVVGTLVVALLGLGLGYALRRAR